MAEQHRNPQSGNNHIRIEGSAIGSALVSGSGNTVYGVHQYTEQAQVPPSASPAQGTTLGPNPYKGLAALKEQDAERYFDRDDQINRLWQRFQSPYKQSALPRVLPILGPSGCGKSSWLGRLRRFIRDCLPQNRPLLGGCWGWCS